MNTQRPNNPPPHLGGYTNGRRESRWLWIPVAILLGAMVLFPLMLLSGVASFLRPGSDTSAMVNGLELSGSGEWQKQIAVNVGGLTLGALRIGLSFAHLDGEARALLESVRGVEVGIYQSSRVVNSRDRVKTLASTDTAMSARGWDRAVGIIDGATLVAVYVPAEIGSPGRMKCCVMVFEGERMIVVSARINPEPLVQCLLHHPAVREKMQWLAKR
jgi:hypothetical protein